MKKLPHKTLILAPYLALGDVIKMNGVVLWPFTKYKDTFIRDEALREHISKLFACYVSAGGALVPNPTVISIRRVNFSNPTAKTQRKIDTLRDVLLFTGVLRNNSHNFITSDNLDVYYQNFNVGSQNLAIRGGAIHQILSGGYTIDEIKFVTPPHIHMSFTYNAHESVIKALLDCVMYAAEDNSKNSILLSLGLFFSAYRNGHEHSTPSRILNMIIAFELLFQGSARSHFKMFIEKYTNYQNTYINEPKYLYPIMNTITNQKEKEESLTYRQIWAEEFYKLRHKIIHANTVSDSDFVFEDLLGITNKRNPHFYIATEFYVVCVLNKLRELGYPNIPRWNINPYAPEDALIKDLSGIKNKIFPIEILL